MHKKIFAMRLKDLLKEKKIKQVDLAEMCYVTPVTVSRWVNPSNKQTPDDATIELIATKLKTRSEYLKGIDDFKTLPEVIQYSSKLLKSFNPEEYEIQLQKENEKKMLSLVLDNIPGICGYQLEDISDISQYHKYMESAIKNSIDFYMKNLNQRRKGAT